jgi:hypothetical protein
MDIPPQPGGIKEPESIPASIENIPAPEPQSVPPGMPSRVNEMERPRFTISAKPVEPKPAPFSERVLELHRAGFSEDLIAKRLGTTIGEVDLAIALSGRMDSAHVDDTGN